MRECACKRKADFVRAPAEVSASVFTVVVLLALELFVCREGCQIYLRALAFVQLMMIWCSVRSDDVQGLLPNTTSLGDSGLSIDLARSKTTGPDRRTRRVKGLVERSISRVGLVEGLWSAYTFLPVIISCLWLMKTSQNPLSEV